jgi:hypothetical protein
MKRMEMAIPVIE